MNNNESKNGVKKVTYRHYRVPAEHGHCVACSLYGQDITFDYFNMSFARYHRGYGFDSFDDCLCPIDNIEPKEKGGLTACTVVDNYGNEFIGTARCSEKDHFIYKRGREIAYGRALKKFNEHTRGLLDD